MTIRKSCFIVFLFLIKMVQLKAETIDTISVIREDSIQLLIENDFKEIDKQLKINEINLIKGKVDSNVFVFHSSASIVQTTSEKYLFWGSRMNHNAVKASYGVDNSSEEEEINSILENLHNQTGRKLIVYVASISTYPEVTADSKFNDEYKGNRGYRDSNVPLIYKYLSKVQSSVEKSVYGNNPKDFTTILVIRIAKFKYEVIKKSGKETWEFDSEINVGQKLASKHAVRVLPAKYILSSCITEIKSVFNNEIKSDLKKFVTDLSQKFRSISCDPEVDCSVNAAVLKKAILDKNSDDILKAINKLIYPYSRGQIVSYGSTEVNYNIYFNVLQNCLTVSEKVNAIKVLLDLNWTGTSQEGVIIDLIKYSSKSPADIELFFNSLVANKVVHRLISDIQGENYERLIREILILHQRRNFDTKSSKAIYWGVYSQSNPTYEDGVYIDTDVLPDDRITAKGFYKCEFKLEENKRVVDEIFSPFENVCITFLSPPTKLDDNTYRVGKIYNLPAIFLRYLDKSTWNGILLASAVDVFELAMSPLAVAEIKAAKGLWKMYLIILTTANSANFGLKSPSIRNQILQTENGAAFLKTWDICLIAANVGYFSPFAKQFGIELITSFKNTRTGLKSTLSATDFATVENTVVKVEQEFKTAGVIVDEVIAVTKASLLQKYKDYAKISEYINSLDEVADASLLSKLDDLDISYYSKLETDFLSKSNGDAIRSLMKESPDDINIWMQLKDDPAFAFDLSKTGGDRWQKWGQANYFKDVTKKGKDFEELVCKVLFGDRTSSKYLELKNKFSLDFGKNLDDYEMFSQVQLKFSGEDYFIADQLFVKYKTIGGQRVIDDIVVIENKLSSSTPLTNPQKGALDEITYIVRSKSEESVTKSGQFISQGEVLKFSGNRQWYKVNDGVDGQTILGINKIQ